MNKALAQITELFRSLTPGARITAGLLLAVVVVAVAYLFNASVSGPDTYLLGGRAFSDKEMGRIQVAFGDAGLSNWQQIGMQIRIPSGQQAQYLAALAKGNALPRDFGSAIEQIIQDSNPFTSEQRFRDSLAAAKVNLVTQVIEKFETVDSASVMITDDKPARFGRKPARSASVIVFPKSGSEVTDSLAKACRELVGPAFGIEPRNISVVDGTGERVIAANGSETVGAGGNGLLLAKKDWEDLYRDKVELILNKVPGVDVTAEVKVLPESASTQKVVKLDKQNRTEIQTSEQTSESTSQSGGPGGQPGLESNSPVVNGTASVGVANAQQTSQNDSTSSTQTSYATPFTETTTEIAGYNLEQVSIAVSVPDEYFASIWRKANPAPEGQPPVEPTPADLTTIKTDEIKKIKEQVAAILPAPQPGVPAIGQVTVNSFPPLPAREPPATSFVDVATNWLTQSWSTVAMCLLAGFGLMTLRSLTKGIPFVSPSASAPASGAPALAIAPETTEESAGGEAGAKPAAPRLKRRNMSGPSLREELSEIVKEDPDAAANVLRAWIGSAS